MILTFDAFQPTPNPFAPTPKNKTINPSKPDHPPQKLMGNNQITNWKSPTLARSKKTPDQRSGTKPIYHQTDHKHPKTVISRPTHPWCGQSYGQSILPYYKQNRMNKRKRTFDFHTAIDGVSFNWSEKKKKNDFENGLLVFFFHIRDLNLLNWIDWEEREGICILPRWESGGWRKKAAVQEK